jgi:LemA protein
MKLKNLNIMLMSLVSVLFLTGCGIQSIPQSKNAVDAALAEISNQYKRRADLIPNLVNVVKGYAKHENQTLKDVVEARAKATSVNIDASKLNAENMKQYQQAQGQLTQALSKLMVVAENYPQLKADRNFSELQAQLEGTENRITVARGRYIDAIKEFNNLVTVPPTSWTNGLFYHHEKLPQWEVSAEEAQKNQQAPQVNF